MKSAIRFSIPWMILSCPLAKKVPELVRTLQFQTWEMSGKRILHGVHNPSVYDMDKDGSVNNKPAIFAFSSCTVHNCWLYHAGFRQVNQMYALLSCLSPFHQTKAKSAVDPSAGVQHTKGDALLNNSLQDEQNLSPCAGLRHSKSCFQAPFKKYSIHQKRVAGIRISFQN